MPSKSSTLPKVPGTIQRGGRYHVNIKIPEPLRDRYGGKDIYRESTGTSDPSQASRRVIEVRAMLSLEKESAAKAADLDRLVSALRPDDQEIFKAAGGLKGLIRRFDDRRVAAAFIEAAKPSRDPHDRSDEMVQADLAGHHASADVMRGYLNRDGKILRQLEVSVELDGEAFSLRDLVDQYAPTVDPQTADAVRLVVDRFTEFSGDLPLDELTPARLRAFADACRDLPAHQSSKKQRAMTFPELIADAKARNLKRVEGKTVSRYCDMLKSLTAFASAQAFIAADPWKGYKPRRVKRKYSEEKKDRRRSFTGAEVRLLLNHVRDSDHPKFGFETIDRWAPWIGAHHGLRIQEVCQLRLSDFPVMDGVQCLRVTDEGDDQKAKSRGTVRVVPLHPRLIAEGLPDLVAQRTRETNEDAFVFRAHDHRRKGLKPLSTDGRGRVSGAYGKRFATLRDALGLPKGEVSFHSFRHRFQDMAREAGIPDSHSRHLTGRASGDAVEDGYGIGPGAKALLPSLEKISPLEG